MAGISINPCLMYKLEAEEAVALYTSIFKNSKVISKVHYSEADLNVMKEKGFPPEMWPGKPGDVKAISFELDGNRFAACNGGNFFSFNFGVSLYVRCQTQEDIDYYHSKLSENGGHIEDCGWVRDKFNVPWQITAAQLDDWMKDDAKGHAVAAALMKMKKIDVAKLQEAYDKG